MEPNCNGPFPSVAVIANDAIGNFVVATPLLQMLRAQFRARQIAYFGGLRTELFQTHSTLIDRSELLFGIPVADAIDRARALRGQFDLVVNLENSSLAKSIAAFVADRETRVVGHCVSETGRGDLEPGCGEMGEFLRQSNWTVPGYRRNFPSLSSNFISEIFVRMCGIKGPIPRYQLPSEPVVEEIPDILISTSASLDVKLWSTNKWLQVASQLNKEGFTIGIVGAPPSQRGFWKGHESEDALVEGKLAVDFRGRWNLLESVGALRRTKLAICIDNGVGHMAAAAGCENVVLYREGIHQLWAPPYPECTALYPAPGFAVDTIEMDSVMEAALSRLTGAKVG